MFVPDIELAIQDFVAKWQDRDESLNFAQRYCFHPLIYLHRSIWVHPARISRCQGVLHPELCRYDPDIVKDELRPLVFEQVRKQVDEEMRTLLQNLKVGTLRDSPSPR